MSAQARLPSLRQGGGSYPTAYLRPGEMIRLDGTRFVVKGNAWTTIQYQGDDDWFVIPMSAQLGKPLPKPLAWIADVERLQEWAASPNRRPTPMWQPLTAVTEEGEVSG